jgi:malonate decarboxylase gamma subunit
MMNVSVNSIRGKAWFAALTGGLASQPGYSDAVLVADVSLAGQPVRYIAVVPDEHNRFPRVRNGEVGLVEGWEIAKAVQQVIARDRDSASKTALVAVIDVASQAYGRREEGYGIHQALAAAAGAYASARLAGHAVIGLIVGKAISGAFLAHGYQANRLIAVNDSKVMVHAMGKESAARITLRSVDALESLAATVPPMAYDIVNYASLGLLWRMLDLQNADWPSASDLALALTALQEALADIASDPDRGLKSRLGAGNRQASSTVREKLRRQWHQAPS